MRDRRHDHDLEGSEWGTPDDYGRRDAVPGRAPGRRARTDLLQRASSSGGVGLPAPLRESLEAASGEDLDGVRLHHGDASAEAAGALGAKAYTLGQEVHFGAGWFDPSSRDGQRLIAHEVAHTVQQRGAAAAPALEAIDVSTPGDAHEVEADRFASAFLAGARAPVSRISRGVVARQVIQREGEPGAAAPPAAGATADGAKGKPAGPAAATLLVKGAAAMEYAARSLPLQVKLGPITVTGPQGPVQLAAGATIEDKLLVLVSPAYVEYAIDARIYRMGTDAFLRSVALNALARGAKAAEGMVALAKFEVGLLVGVFVGWQLALGIGVAKAVTFFISNQKKIEQARGKMKDLGTQLDLVKKHSPMLATLLFRASLVSLLLRNLHHGITGEEIGNFLGKLIRGGYDLAETTFLAVAKMVATTVAAAIPTTAALATMHLAEQGAKKAIPKVVAALRELGIAASEEEAAIVLRELEQAGPAASSNLQALQRTLLELVPLLRAIAKNA